jgi:hypothetical protein
VLVSGVTESVVEVGVVGTSTVSATGGAGFGFGTSRLKTS